MTADRVDLKAGTLVFESLEEAQAWRLPSRAGAARLSRHLNMVHDLSSLPKCRDRGAFDLALPKGLPLGFGIKAVTSGIPLNMVQKCLGHAQLPRRSRQNRPMAVTPKPAKGNRTQDSGQALL